MRHAGHLLVMRGFVLVGGWPGSGKTTLARGLAEQFEIAYLGKDEIKEALMDAWGPPCAVEDSRRFGVAAVLAMLRVARGCPAAVIDSTWYPYTVPLVRALPGPCLEVRCRVPLDLARRRFASRSRDDRHLDRSRTDAELWGDEVAPLGVGPLVEVDTSRPVDLVAVADVIRLGLGQAELGPSRPGR